MRSIVLPGSDQLIESKVCKVSNSCFGPANRAIFESAELQLKYCSHCTEACNQIDYIVTPSAADAPADIWLHRTKTFVENLAIPLPDNWTTSWQEEIKGSYVSVDVVFQTSMVENYTQAAVITAIDVLSNVGGHTGLWIGISFLSIMEIIEMLYRLMRHEIRRLTKRVEPTSDNISA
jgi:hypothetical protein